MLDEAWACIATGRRWAVTSETSTRFHRAVYVDKPHLVEAEITETTIMNIGRWQSRTWLTYIHNQIAAVTAGVSRFHSTILPSGSQ